MREKLQCKCTPVHLCRMTWIFFFLMGIVFSQPAEASQDRVISGVVVSAMDSEPLIGVSVQIQGTTNGTITDIDGNYSLNAATGQTLIFSYIGYVSQEIKIQNQSKINVTLKEGI